MKTSLSFLLVALFGFTPLAEAQTKKNTKPAATRKVARPAARSSAPITNANSRQQLARALELARGGQYQAAATSLYSLSRRPDLQADRAQIKYILGLMLMEMKLNQTAAFQFVDVIRLNHPKYTRLAVEKLSIAADTLGDDTLLNYALNRLNISEVPAANRDMVWFRVGEVKLKNKDYAGAQDAFSKVRQGSSYFNQATYNRGLALLEMNKVDEAMGVFRNLLALRSKAKVTDTNKVAAQLALARALYQKGDWEGAVEAYAAIPRDHVLWHDAIFEQSWAMLRSARFRSAMSNFQSLHSAYYEDFYVPEALLLRAIVYLYICKYDEMEKVLQLFEKTYGPVSGQVRDFLNTHKDSMPYFQEAERALQARRGKSNAQARLPTLVMNSALGQGNVRRAFSYLRVLNEEQARVEANYPFKSSPMGQYAMKIISNRKRNTQLAIGDMVKAHLTNIRTELRDLYEQAGFIRYEMINGQKEVIKKKIAGKDIEEDAVDEDIARSFYVQNGYQYYPFQGEYWLDEIGNFHYLGKSSCE
ncbi:MAG: tetratricopeptide repeat protein [Bdellovibrionaceae bacterium]|nr:tetratricopeptide repeat protein [Pseudobdellovibrionaceae bacterium]